MVVYLPSVVRDGFVSIDDSLLITKNAAVQAFTLKNIFHVFTSYDPELYIPLTFLTYQIEFAIVGAQAFLFHFTNLLLHTGSAVTLFFLLRRFFGSDVIACIGALLFVLHPINTEAVAWAAARKDVLSAFFFFATLLSYEKFREEQTSSMRRWSVLFFVLALLSKVTVALLPLVLILLDWRRGNVILSSTKDDKRKSWFVELTTTWSYFALSAIFIVIALFGKAKGINALGPLKTILLGAKAVSFYLLKLVLPVHLSVIYSQDTAITLSSPEFWIPVLVVVAVVALIVLLMRTWRDAAFGLTFFLLLLLPNFANFWKNRFIFFASDRYAYIPSVGIIVIVCSCMAWMMSRSVRLRQAAVGVSSAIILIFAFLTFRQTSVWQNDIVLYQNVLLWYPQSALASNNLGAAYVQAKDYEKGLQWISVAVTNKPDYIQAMRNAGNVERERGNFDAARAWYEKAVAQIPTPPFPEDLGARYLLGEMLVDLGKTDEGLAQFELATKALPDLAEPYYNLALQMQKLGRGDEAIPLFEKAISLDASHIAARYHVAGLYAERGRLAEARNQLEQVVAIDPNYQEATKHLAGIKNLLNQ
jgi:tetratricopeptide (TPR) repeat protein